MSLKKCFFFFLIIIIFFSCGLFRKYPISHQINNAKTNLIIRDNPSIDAKKIGSILDMEKVDIYKFSEDEVIINNIKDKWAYIKYKNKKGWVFGGYLKEEGFFTQRMKLELSDYQINEHKIIKLKMSIPHGSYFVIINPDGDQFYIISYGHAEKIYEQQNINYDNFYKIKEIEIDTKTLMSRPSVVNRTNELVFNKNGIYTLVIASYWESCAAVSKQIQLNLNIK